MEKNKNIQGGKKWYTDRALQLLQDRRQANASEAATGSITAIRERGQDCHGEVGYCKRLSLATNYTKSSPMHKTVIITTRHARALGSGPVITMRRPLF